jgi:DUF438 domain-containing protein
MIGKLSDSLINAMLEVVPFEFSVIDAADTVVGWNRHDSRVFKRPEKVLGRDVRLCHPKHSLDQVEQLLDEMKAGARDSARFWIDFPVGVDEKKEKILIEYYALRNNRGEYLGCIEVTQNIQSILSIAGEKRLMD